MNTSVVEIGQYEALTRFHRGITPQEALVMVEMTARGVDLCVITDDNDVLLIKRWEVTNENGVGQIMAVCEKNYEASKANNFQPIS